jgi:hypothetical protein
MKKMKHERKSARLARNQVTPESDLAVVEALPTPDVGEPVKAVEVEAEPVVIAKPRRREAQSLLEQIESYVKAFDFGRLKSTVNRALQSGELTEDQVDGVIDAALPSAARIRNMPLNKALAAASIASDEKRRQYQPVLMLHAQHAKNLPEAEAGQVKEHLALLGFLEQEMA